MELQPLLFALADAWHTGGRGTVTDLIENELRGIAECRRLTGGLAAVLPGQSDRMLLFDAHIDEVALYITAVKGTFALAAPAGGLDGRVLPAAPVVLHGKTDVRGVFCSTPPHLQKDKNEPKPADERYIDVLTGHAASQLRPGDAVTFDVPAAELTPGAVTGKALDDRAGCAALIAAAKILCGKVPPVTVCFLFSDMEEIGLRGAGTNAFALRPGEAVAVDVSFASEPGVPPERCGRPGRGPMIGVSPVLDRAVTDTLSAVCEREHIPFQTEVMGGETSTDADRIALTAGGIPTGLCSIPLGNMHTPGETVRLCDVEATARLLAAYALGGGAFLA